MGTRQAVFVAAYDSQLKWCARIRDEFERRGFECRVVVPAEKSALSLQQIADAGFADVEILDAADLLTMATDADVLVSALAGPATRALTYELATRLPDRPGPVIITGWVGVIIEKIIAGYLDRSGSDLIAVNSTTDFEQFSHAAEYLDLPPDNLLLAGLPLLHGMPHSVRTEIKTVLFADQPTVPTSEAERLYVYRALLDYARRHPDRQVVLKPRHRLGESTYHRMRHHPERLLAGDALPPNVRFDYTPIAEALPSTDLLLTMSSTACLEALDHGCRVGLILDLGVHERYGNHVFMESGLLRTFSQLERDEIGEPRPEWLAGYFFDRPASAVEVIGDRAEELLATGRRPSREAWASEYFKSAAAFHRAMGSRTRLGRTHPYGWRALHRRIDRHGPVRGTVRHAIEALVPPVLKRPLLAAARPLARSVADH